MLKQMAAGLVLAMAGCWHGASQAATAPDCMPRAEDYTLMWWQDGFPSHTPAAPWRRWVQTGHYQFALDTDIMRIAHLGPAPAGTTYAQAATMPAKLPAPLAPAALGLRIEADGKTYRCTRGGAWSQFQGPRLIESGRFMQRGDVTDLVFEADDGARLNAQARFETIAWPDRLGLVLAARPGVLPIPAGESCFGRVGGGFGLDGRNHFEIAHRPALDPEQFTLEFWTFVPTDFRVSSRTPPWLVCKNRNEEADGNFGMLLLGDSVRATMNLGGGRTNKFAVDSRPPSPLRLEAWNHLAMTYDGDSLRLYVNGAPAGATQIGKRRTPGRDGLAFGRRQDNSGDGYHFRGAIDEIGLYDRALTAAQVAARANRPETELPGLAPADRWSFRADGQPSLVRPSEQWRRASMEIAVDSAQGRLAERWSLPADETWNNSQWHQIHLALSPTGGPVSSGADRPSVAAAELPGGAARPVVYDPAQGWHRVNLDGIVPQLPPAANATQNDAMERVRLVLTNPADTEQPARLLFEKSARGFRQSIGSAITGISAVLCDAEGLPTGIPVQLSKNWHNRAEAGVYAGAWFHGFTLLRLPPRATIELELRIAYGHWGGVSAASHAQLCLIGWGSNQLWDQSALGSWGESICYEPDQAQAHCGILDVRPVMVRSMSHDQKWSWTHNVGGGDFFRLFDAGGSRVYPAGMRTVYHRQGPCLTEVSYAGTTGPGMVHSATVSLARGDDLVRGIYRLRLDVRQPVPFSRLALFQIGADSYSYTGERKMAVGNETGLVREWNTTWGGDTYRTAPMECRGRVPWISLHEAMPRRTRGEAGAWANRGVVIRHWNARLGGRPTGPWAAEYGVNARGSETSTIDLVPPPGVGRLEAGDFVEAIVEHVIMPQFATDYYGPNQALRAALEGGENTWRMIEREAVGNDRRVQATVGTIEAHWPAVRIRPAGGQAEFTLAGGLGYVPLTFVALTSPRGWKLEIDGQPFEPAVHGHDYWQTDYDAGSRTWQVTFNLPANDQPTRRVRFLAQP